MPHLQGPEGQRAAGRAAELVSRVSGTSLDIRVYTEVHKGKSWASIHLCVFPKVDTVRTACPRVFRVEARCKRTPKEFT